MARSGREGKKKGKGLGIESFSLSKTDWFNRFISPIVDSGGSSPTQKLVDSRTGLKWWPGGG